MNQCKPVWQKISALFLCILLAAAFPLQTLAIEQELTPDPIPLTEEVATYLVTLANFDGNETLASLSVAQEGTLTLAEIDAQVTAPLRDGYIFMGWSTKPGDVLINATMKTSWVISADTTLYAVYRAVGSGDIDAGLMVETMDAIEAMDTAVSKYGISLKTVINLPQRDEQFYEYLDEYLQSRAPEVMAAGARSARAVNASLSGARMQHAFDDASWSVKQHPDLNFSKELLYSYTAHYIDKAEPFGGTQVDCDVNFLEKYITDMDRNVYANFYRTAGGIDIYKSCFDLVSLTYAVPNTIRAATSASGPIVSVLDNLAAGMSDKDLGKSLRDDLVALNANNLNYIAGLSATSKEELFAKLDARNIETAGDIYINHGQNAEDLAKNTFYGVVAVVAGGGVFDVLATFAGLYNSIFVTLLDQANFVGMRSSIHARVPNRILYYYGMNDGRDRY